VFPFSTRKNKRGKLNLHIAFDEVLVDASLHGSIDEAKPASILEKPFSRFSFFLFFTFIIFLLVFLLTRVSWLTLLQGEAYAKRAASNSIQKTVFSPPRGLIYDRKGRIIVENRWVSHENEIQRTIHDDVAFSHVIGFVGLPALEDVEKDLELYNFSAVGRDGVEYFYDEYLRGELGEQLQEVDADGIVVSEGIIRDAVPGKSIVLTLDAEFQKFAYEALSKTAAERGFQGGALIVFDVVSGEVFALISIPSFNVNLFSGGISSEEFKKLLENPSNPFFNRAIAGNYPPGSAIKPYIAVAALTENIITANKQIFSSGSISIPDPYYPGRSTVFKDWRAHGFVDMRRALAVSSNVYFYAIGGGFGDVKGLGIKKIREWLYRFGFGSVTGIDLAGEKTSVVPGPDEKQFLHPSDPIWRIGDTYHVSIGQGDVLATPIQAARAIGGLANGEYLPTLHLLKKVVDDDMTAIKEWTGTPVLLHLNKDELKIVHEGLKLAALEGTASALGSQEIPVAVKTGTAQAAEKNRTHSWLVGFAPSQEPKLGMVVFLEAGPSENQVGSVFVALQLLNWISEHGGIAELTD